MLWWFAGYTSFDWTVASGVVVGLFMALYALYEIRRIRRLLQERG